MPEPLTISPASIPSALAIGSIRVMMSTPIWLYWAELAIENEAEAARRRAAADTSNPGRSMIAETKSAMVAITSSAHALDAFCGKFAQQIMPEQLRRRWADGRGRRAQQVYTALRHGFWEGRNEWQADLVWLFQDSRNYVLHHTETTQDLVRHPIGGNTAPELVQYSKESAERAVDLMLDIVVRCTANPKPPARKESEAIRYQVRDLLDLRASLPA